MLRQALSFTFPSGFSWSVLCFVFLVQHHSNMLVNSMLSAPPTQQFVDSRAQQRHSNIYQSPKYLPKYQQQFEQNQHQSRYSQNNNNNNNNNINDDMNNNINDNTKINQNNNNYIYHRNKQAAAVSRGHSYEPQSSLPYDQQIQRPGLQIPNTALAERSQHKCPIWVPIEAFEKYPWAGKIQVDQSNQLQLIEICCPGFGPIRWRGNTLCRPLCDNCQNGLCLEPGVCQCYEEFVKNDSGDCVFSCPLGCLNGRCYLDGSCQCDPGYKLDETRKFCRPICSAGCGQNSRHNCTEPEVCGCATGYRLTDNGCQPTCTPDCGVGGICREYNLCECRLGYTLKNGACQSECYQKCDNGICYGRNRCICNPGFTYHEKSTQCIPA